MTRPLIATTLLLLVASCIQAEDASGKSPGPPPGPDWTWEDGHWDGSSGQQAWVEGRYRTLPPKPSEAPQPPAGMRWQPGHWSPAGDSWQWVPGRYEAATGAPAPVVPSAAAGMPVASSTPASAAGPSAAPTPASPPQVVVHDDPPPIRVEVVPCRPDPDAVWRAGHWTWTSDGWIWVGGCWSHHRGIWFGPRWIGPHPHHDHDWGRRDHWR